MIQERRLKIQDIKHSSGFSKEAADREMTDRGQHRSPSYEGTEDSCGSAGGDVGKEMKRLVYEAESQTGPAVCSGGDS
ncbi:E3 ubiquitin-protein ligase TRIM39-like protein [Lates japonicus]|uniref:E3 ubiquitin-protein ligase TRIM39-like protein n=1 Tax=Lates japonicus TaxID=270547 RepID=A0AAD3M6J5_LATJO|nr:E3 ubiquitin-protein ligase TRIM39-like protein [Lates japonicus]